MKWDRRVLVIPDLHLPYEDKRACANLLEFAASEKWDRVVMLGDVMDFNLFSAFNDGRPGLTEGIRVVDHVNYGKDWIDKFARIVRKRRPGCEIDITEGNHEYRVIRYLEKYPMWKGSIEPQIALGLDKMRIRWVPYWSQGEVVRIGKASFGHGFSEIQNHAAKHARDWGGSFFYGHIHDVQEFPIYRPAKQATIKAKSLGCLCETPPWMRGKPMRWQHAFGVFHFWPDGTFQETTVHIHKGRFLDPLGGRQFG